jgi:membrane protease YdiL (CAAX protease family)
MTVLLLSYLWLWQGRFPGDFWVCIVLYFGIGIGVHLPRQESASEIGFGLANFGRAMGWVVRIVGPLIVLTVVTGWTLGSLDYGPPRSWITGLSMGILWGTAQQFGLIAVYYRLLRELLHDDRKAAFVSATVFALFHIPNPFLVGVTWVTGLIACWIYRRAPNIWALGIAHGVLSAAISGGLPERVTFGMAVGPGFWRFLQQ